MITSVVAISAAQQYRSTDLLKQFYGCERLCRPRPETTEGELGLLAGFDIHKDIVVLLLGWLTLPIEIRGIVCGHLDVCPAHR
jgi:hypothetical protein